MYIPLKPLFSRHKGIGVQFTDEPTGNLDSASALTIMDSLVKVNKKAKKALIIVTHDPLVASYCEKILFLKDGSIIDQINSPIDQKQKYKKIIDTMINL